MGEEERKKPCQQPFTIKTFNFVTLDSSSLEGFGIVLEKCFNKSGYLFEYRPRNRFDLLLKGFYIDFGRAGPTFLPP